MKERNLELNATAYPAPLMQEYHALTDKKLCRAITPAESVRLQEIRCAIAEIDVRQPRPNMYDIQTQRLREELAQIRAEVEALPDMTPVVVDE